MKVSDMLTRKGTEVVSLSPSASVLDALRIMSERNMGSVVIVDNGQYKGIVTERDYSRKVILMGKNSTDTPVSEIMSTDLPFISPSDTVDRCMELMSDKHIRYLPVFNADGQLAGIISISDVVACKLRRQQETIQHLHDYISR